METAANPKFRHSLLHSHMFQYHVLEDSSLPDPGFLPYYPPSFFQTIKKIHEDTPLNVKTMSLGRWVRVLTEDGLTMEITREQTRQFIPCKAELASPRNNWELSWRLCRLKGLNSEMTSFNFKLLHGLLPVRERLHHLTPTTSPSCTLCNEPVSEDVQHALLTCSYNGGSGQALLDILSTFIPDLTYGDLLLLQFPDLSEGTLASYRVCLY